MRFQLISPIISKNIHTCYDLNEGAKTCYNELKANNYNYSMNSENNKNNTFSIMNVDTFETYKFQLGKKKSQMNGGGDIRLSRLDNMFHKLAYKVDLIDKNVKLLCNAIASKNHNDIQDLKHKINQHFPPMQNRLSPIPINMQSPRHNKFSPKRSPIPIPKRLSSPSPIKNRSPSPINNNNNNNNNNNYHHDECHDHEDEHHNDNNRDYSIYKKKSEKDREISYKDKSDKEKSYKDNNTKTPFRRSYKKE